jgi:type I restriction enzyme S subunit
MKRATVPLGDFLTLKRGYDLPEHARVVGEVPVVSSSGITGTHKEAKVDGPGVVTGRYGTLGEVFYIDEPFWPLNTALYVQDFKGNHPRFVSYFLKWILNGKQSDKAAVPGVNRNDLHARQVKVPCDLSEQAAIASILSAYDNLIENNRRRIQLLEQAARLLYKEWFVRLRFPGHEHTKIINGIPEGWEKKPLGDVAPLKYGRALKNEDRISGPFPVYGSSGIIGTHTKPLVSGPTIIVGRKGNVGSVYWSPDDCHPIDTVYFIDSERCSFFLYYSLQQMNFISTDVAVPGLNRDFAHSRSILVADQKILRFFEDTVLPLHQQMELLKKQASALAQARDLLLPRLMNGEISV